MTDLFQRARMALLGWPVMQGPLARRVAAAGTMPPQDLAWPPVAGDDPGAPDDAEARTGRGRDGAGGDAVRQQIAGLVHRTFLTPDRTGAVVRSIVFAGVDDTAGSAALAAASAELLAARVTGAVCLIDADVHAPSVHRLCGVINVIGLAEALTGGEPMRTYARRLTAAHDNPPWLLTAGATGADAGSLLMAPPDSGRIRDLIDAFDYVVMQAPAVLRHPAASVLGAQVDGVVLVTEANVTRRESVRAAVETLRACGVRVLGTVLNNRTFPIPDSLYRRL